MAGAGYKLFQTGDVLTAAQVNTYLNEQTVMVFANAAARTSALTSVLAEGMVSYLQDTNAVEVYNGSAWVGISGAGDVTEVQAGTGISVASGTGPIPVVTNTMATAIDAAGDLIYGTGADTFARLGIGTAGQVLKVNSGATAPEWGAAAGGSTFAGCSLYRTVDQTGIASATNTAILWDAEHFDTDAYHSTSSNTSRITIPSGKAGKYLICGMTELSVASATKVQTIIYVNGSIVRFAGDYQGTGTNIKGPYSIVLDLAVSDYIEIYARQDSGSNADAVGGSQRITVAVSLLGA